MDFYKQRYAGKKIAILGFGREGKSSYEFLRRVEYEAEITLIDEDLAGLEQWQAENPSAAVRLVKFEQDRADELNQYDLIFRTPGFSRTKLTGVDEARITSQTNEFLLTQSGRTIAITGTKGKSTTSSLTRAVLTRLGVRAKLVGNIGQPALDLLTEELPEWFVYEMSSYQCENLSVAPAIGVVLNLYEEHLDHYAGFADYVSAKLRLISLPGQKLAIFGWNNQLLKSKREDFLAEKVLAFGEVGENEPDELADGIYLKNDQIIKVTDGVSEVILAADFERKLRGRHNLVNALVALIVADELVGLDQRTLPLAEEAIAEFAGLEHRLEAVGKFRGIDFYNDSISTIPQATIAAILALGDLQTVIIGGNDRGVDQSELVEFLATRMDLKVICLPKTGHDVFDQLKNQKYLAEDLAQAVRIAYEITEAGKACVLSPGATSYGFFANFEQRGREFKQLVAEFGRESL